MRRWRALSRPIICLVTLALALAGVSSVAPSAVAAATGHITGTVTDLEGTPIGDVQVIAHMWLPEYGTWDYRGDATTHEDGTYDVGDLDVGTYRVEFFDGTEQGYVGEYWDNATSIDSATSISVSSGQTISGKNAQLTPGGHITGTVTGTGGVPLEEVEITAYRNDGDGWDSVEHAWTDADGDYDLLRLSAGNYRIRFSDSSSAGYLTSYYSGATSLEAATSIPVTAGQITSGKDAQLSPGGHITGTVTTSGGAALADAEVNAYRSSVDGWSYERTTKTTSSGAYDLGGLPTGTYRIQFDPWMSDGEYLSEYWDDAGSLNTATDINVTVGTTVSGRNAQLAAESSMAVSNTALPTITGTPKVGAPVTATPGTWTPAGTTTSYHWLVGGTPVTGATAATYTPAAADVGKTLQVEVSATKDGYTAATATSAAKTITKGTLKATKKPKVTGKAKKNATLTVSPGTWSPQAKATYQWYAGSKAIAKATAAKLKLTGKTLKAVAGKTISVVLTVTSPGYTTSTVRLKVPGKAKR